MFYAPHILYKRVTEPATYDEDGNPIKPTSSWVFVCRCRCDDDYTQEIKEENGKVYRPKFKIVCELNADIDNLDEVKVLTEDGSVRGYGIAHSPKSCNWYDYKVVWA